MNKQIINIVCSYSDLKDLKKIKIPKKINGFFDCSNNNLETLEGSPEYVEEDYCCNDNVLTSLKGRPKIINDNFDCSSNKLTSLEYCPKIIKSNLYCQNNELKNVKDQIIKYQIKAELYSTDEGNFWFDEIKEDFEKYNEYLLKKEKQKREKQQKDDIIKEKQIIKKNKIKINKINDFGLSI